MSYNARYQDIDDYDDSEEEKDSSIIPILGTIVKWFIRLGIVFAVIVALYYLIMWLIPNVNFESNIKTFNPIVSLKEFYQYSFGIVFSSGLDFSDYITKHGFSNFVLTLITTTISFCLVNIFDNIGSLQAACEQGKLLKNNLDNIKK